MLLYRGLLHRGGNLLRRNPKLLQKRSQSLPEDVVVRPGESLQALRPMVGVLLQDLQLAGQQRRPQASLHQSNLHAQRIVTRDLFGNGVKQHTQHGRIGAFRIQGLAGMLREQALDLLIDQHADRVSAQPSDQGQYLLDARRDRRMMLVFLPTHGLPRLHILVSSFVSILLYRPGGSSQAHRLSRLRCARTIRDNDMPFTSSRLSFTIARLSIMTRASCPVTRFPLG